MNFCRRSRIESNIYRSPPSPQVVTVLLDKEKMEIYPSTHQIRINRVQMPLNGTYTVRNSANKVLANIRLLADSNIHVQSDSHLLQLLINDRQIIVLASPVHRGRTCGLCGDNDGNKLTDLTGPMKCSLPAHLMSVAYETPSTPAGCKSSTSAANYEELMQLREKCLHERYACRFFSIFGILFDDFLF